MGLKIKHVKEISDLIGADPPFNYTNLNFNNNELERILNQLKDWEIKDFDPIGDRPERKKKASEFLTGYRQKISEYIKLNTGIEIPVNASIGARFYDLVADYLGL